MTEFLFYKMQSLGNDFVIIDKNTFQGNKEQLFEYFNAEFIQNICHRNFGIGCDQLIFFDHKHLSSTVEVDIFNADATKAKACGNAMRCLAKLLDEYYGFKEISFKIGKRYVESKKLDDNFYQVDMGKASTKWQDIPLNKEIDDFFEQLKIDHSMAEVIQAVNMGNPHLVIFTNKPELFDDKECKRISENEIFQDGVNINIAKITNDVIHIKTYERGVGFTLGCGSGACATSYAAIHNKLLKNNIVDLLFPGGELKVQVAENISVLGGGELVFKGNFITKN